MGWIAIGREPGLNRYGPGGIMVSWHTKIVERVTGGLSKGYEHDWRTWTAPGGQTSLALLVVRTVGPETYQALWDEKLFGDATCLQNGGVRVASVDVGSSPPFSYDERLGFCRREYAKMGSRTIQRDQDINDWVEFLHQLYGSTQNYSKTTYEIHTHLAEVCGIFGKHAFKKRDLEAARDFLPKIFAWSVALLKSVQPNEADLEDLILRKFPGACPYCDGAPCVCSKSEKPSLDPERVRTRFYGQASSIRRGPNDLQLMFKRIYGSTWPADGHPGGGPSSTSDRLRFPYIRLLEELAEMAEALRIYHLYPRNFENELADFMAWWFALVSCMPAPSGEEHLLAEDILWKAYPGICPYCHLFPCFCRPGPVRELMSQPPPGQEHRFDALTALYNQGAHKADVQSIASGDHRVALPIACVRVDLDDFKSVNDAHGHQAGDAALRHVARILRSKARQQDRIYRVGGDEFALLLMDTSKEEASGMMKRVCHELNERPARWVDSTGEATEFHITASIGVSASLDVEGIERAFEQADEASYQSKEGGKARVTVYS